PDAVSSTPLHHHHALYLSLYPYFFLPLVPRPPLSPLFPYTTLFRSDQTSSVQFSGRVQQTYKHSVPRFFVPEHGTMFTLALVRFPPTATKEIQYLNAKGALTYTDIAGDPVLYGN